MKTIAIITTAIIIIALMAAKSPGKESLNESKIDFHSETWNEILALAKKENKPIFLDISASWCGHCKKMKSRVYTDSVVAEYYNAAFINVLVDAEKGEGIELATKYGARGYPTLVFINADGSVAEQTSGYKKAEKFLELGKSISNNK